MNEQKQRDVNLDILRIFSMFLIVFIHSIDHSGVLENADVCKGGTYLWVRFSYALCQVCVNIYVMLSGYYLVQSKFNLRKLVTLWMEIVFYAFTLKLLFMVTGQQAFSGISLISCFFPMLTGRYWFITIYVGLYLIFPFLNKLVYALGRKEHAALNVCLFLLFSVMVSIYPAFAGMNSGGGWGLAWFVVLYLLAAWLRLYYTPKCKPVILAGAFLLIPFLMAVGQSVVNWTGIGVLKRMVANWYRYDSVPVYLMTLALFVMFLNIQVKNTRVQKAVCAVAPLILGVYLIHAHANVSPWLWGTLNLPQYMGHAWFPLVQLGCVVGIFLICIAVDALRKATVGRLERSGTVKAFCDRISAKFAQLLANCDLH